MKVNLLFINSFLMISKFFFTKFIISSTLGRRRLFLDNSETIVSKFFSFVYFPKLPLLIKVLYKLVNDTKSIALNLVSSSNFIVVHKLPVLIARSNIVLPSLLRMFGRNSLFLFNFLIILAV